MKPTAETLLQFSSNALKLAVKEESHDSDDGPVLSSCFLVLILALMKGWKLISNHYVMGVKPRTYA